MANQYTKLSVQQNLNRLATLRALEAIEGIGRSLPCQVTAVNGSIVTVAFELNQPYLKPDGTMGTYTLPPLTLPKAESQWLRAPTQVGDYGITRPADTFLGGVSGLGSGVANTGVDYGNMTTLVWEPIGNTGFGTAPDPNKAWVNGPKGTVVSDTAQTATHVIAVPTLGTPGTMTSTIANPAGAGATTIVHKLDGVANKIQQAVTNALGTVQHFLDGANNQIVHSLTGGAGVASSTIDGAAGITHAVGSVSSLNVNASQVQAAVSSATSTVTSAAITHALGAAAATVTSASAAISAAGGNVTANASGVSMTGGSNSVSVTSGGGTNISGSASLNGGPFAAYSMTNFQASGTFTTPSNSSTSTIYRYRMVGSGGGGGGANAATGAAAGGGGSGLYAEGYFSGVAASTGITITIGNPGTGGANTGGTGGAGSSCVIGTPVSVTCGGGGGGGGSIATTAGSVSGGGSGGSVISGSPNFSLAGNRGFSGQTIVVTNGLIGGNGAGSPFGTGGTGGFSGTQAPTTAVSFGAGGGGATGAATAGASGKSGIVIIERMTP